MGKVIERTCFTQSQIEKRVKELGEQITQDYQGKNPVFIGVLKGCFIFMADLIRSVNLPCSLDFMVVSSYKDDTVSTGAVEIIKDLSKPIYGKDVIIVEDILDSGKTLSYLKSYLGVRQPASIKIITLLNKEERREAVVDADYVGFQCPDEFIVGYGLDYAEKYRNLPYIAVLKDE